VYLPAVFVLNRQDGSHRHSECTAPFALVLRWWAHVFLLQEAKIKGKKMSTSPAASEKRERRKRAISRKLEREREMKQKE